MDKSLCLTFLGHYVVQYRVFTARYTSRLVLGYGFQGRRIEWRYFRLHQIQFGGRPPSWIISNGHISATAHSIHLHNAPHAVIFAIAQLS